MGTYVGHYIKIVLFNFLLRKPTKFTVLFFWTSFRDIRYRSREESEIDMFMPFFFVKKMAVEEARSDQISSHIWRIVLMPFANEAHIESRFLLGFSDRCF